MEIWKMIIAIILVFICIASILFILNLLRYLTFETKIVDSEIIVVFFRLFVIKTINLNDISNITIGLDNLLSLISYQYINRWQIPIVITTITNDKFIITPRNMKDFIEAISLKVNIEAKQANHTLLLKSRTIFFGAAFLFAVSKLITENQFYLEQSNTYIKLLIFISIITLSCIFIFLLYSFLKKLCAWRSNL